MPRPSDLPTTKSSHNSRVFSSGLGPDHHGVKCVAECYCFRPRFHYRIAFEDVGKPLYEKRSLKANFFLKDVVKGSVVFLGGFVSS